VLTNIYCYLARASLSMPISGEDGTSEYSLTEEDMAGDSDMTIREHELDEKVGLWMTA